MTEHQAEPIVANNPPLDPTRLASRRRRWAIAGIKAFVVLLCLWLMLAYVLLPLIWRHYEHNPALAEAPKTTVTGQGIPGDPLNIGLIGDEQSVVRAMDAAGWTPADPITMTSSIRIVASVAFKRPDPNAPVSSLFLFGRRQDLAFERPVGGSARRRHHVRFWKWDEASRTAGPPLWIGSATYDVSVGFSRRTGQVTHHIAPDIDAERHSLIEELIKAGWLDKVYQVTGVGATVAGRNGGGDRYFTDGELTIGVLGTRADADTPDRLPNPSAVELKDQLWSAIGPLLKATTPEPEPEP